MDSSSDSQLRLDISASSPKNVIVSRATLQSHLNEKVTFNAIPWRMLRFTYQQESNLVDYVFNQTDGCRIRKETVLDIYWAVYIGWRDVQRWKAMK